MKRVRSAGRIPAVIYGRAVQPQSLELNVKEIEDLIHHSASETILVDLAVRGEEELKHLALVQAVQHHPLTGQVLHIDFHKVAADEQVTVAVPVEAVGEAAGRKEGGVIEHVLFKIKVRGLPKDLPEMVEVDVTSLAIGQAVHLGEIKLPPGCEVVGDKSIPVIACAAPITEAQEAATLEAATAPLAEPEMLKEKKDEEGVAGGDAAKGKAEVKPGAAPAKPGAAPAKAGAAPAAAAPAAAAKPAAKAPEKKK